MEVAYRQEMPHSDEGPFLKEERKLIDTVAERISGVVTQRRLKAASKPGDADSAPTVQGEWRVVLEFLEKPTPSCFSESHANLSTT